MSDTPKTDFEKAAAEPPRGLVGEFWQFLKHNKKWWLLPILLVLALFGVLLLLVGSGGAPFIYTLF
jgi:drug/metabolite transporter superfamily protein YnfA